MISDQNNPLVLDILRASSTAYSYNPTKKITEVNLVLNALIFSHSNIYIIAFKFFCSILMPLDATLYLSLLFKPVIMQECFSQDL